VLRYLVTLKPQQYRTPTHNYAILAEIDWDDKRVLREVRFPTASYETSSAYHAPLIGGVCRVGERVFVTMFNYIVELDYKTFQIVNSVSHPYTVDLHGLASDGKYLYVAATGIDAVLCFDLQTWDLVWRWGPDDPILYADRIEAELETTVVFMRGRQRKQLQDNQIFQDAEYRHMRKAMTGYHHHHLNDVILHDGFLYITTKQWNHNSKGCVIRLDLASREAEFLIPPDSLDGLHDGVWVDDDFYVTESGANQVAWWSDGKLTHRKIEPSSYFVRGLCDTGMSWLVGFSTLRNMDLPALIVEYNRDFTQIISQMDVSHFYPPEKATTIHAISRA